jgi:hypothetical protein
MVFILKTRRNSILLKGSMELAFLVDQMFEVTLEGLRVFRNNSQFVRLDKYINRRSMRKAKIGSKFRKINRSGITMTNNGLGKGSWRIRIGHLESENKQNRLYIIKSKMYNHIMYIPYDLEWYHSDTK